MSFFGTNTVASHWGWQSRWIQSGGGGGLPTQIQKLIGDSGTGRSVDISSDGNTAVVSSDFGAYVFVNNGGVWTQQAKFTQSCKSVTISSDGNTIVVGEPAFTVAGLQVGRCIKYTRTGTTWTTGTVLPAITTPYGGPPEHYGESVSVSGDGQTIIINSPWSDGPAGIYTGCIYVFPLANTSSVFKLEGGGATGLNQVDISDNGKTFAYAGSSTVANLRIYSTSTSFPNNITSANLINANGANTSVATSCSLSSDGNLVAFGCFEYNSVFIYSRANANSYTQLQKINSPDSTNLQYFGKSVSLSDTGNILYVGATGNNVDNDIGKVFVYENTGNGWNIQGNMMASDGSSFDNFAGSISTSADGNTLIVGASGKSSAYIFGS